LEKYAPFLRAVFWVKVNEKISVALMKGTDKAMEIRV
jgi:hypothetical protein